MLYQELLITGQQKNKCKHLEHVKSAKDAWGAKGGCVTPPSMHTYSRTATGDNHYLQSQCVQLHCVMCMAWLGRVA